jgi:putative hemolysin
MKKTEKKETKRVSPAATAKRWLKTLQEVRESKTYYEKIRGFKPHVEVLYESDDFVVRTAQSAPELLKSLELRHEIFVREWQGRSAYHGLDVDDYDFEGDHLMIIDKRDDVVVGTYRLLCSRFTNKFYSDSEFDLGQLIASPGVKLEMGRACVHQDYRDGNTIDLLWKGLSSYIRAVNCHYLFGCSSVKSTDPVVMSSLYNYFAARDSWTDDFKVRARKKYDFPGFAIDSAKELPVSEAREMIPPLLRSYLHAGAKVYGSPALDRDFACADLLTVLDLSSLNKKFQARYLEGFTVAKTVAKT